MLAGAAFLRGVIAAFPYRLHSILTDNGIPFTDQPRNRSGPTAQYRLHVFDRLRREHGIEHRLTEPYHLWTQATAHPNLRSAAACAMYRAAAEAQRCFALLVAWVQTVCLAGWQFENR